MTPALVLAGNLLVDDLVFQDGRTRMGEAGGAILYGALGARLWGTRVGLVSRVGFDYPVATLNDLTRGGIDLAGVRPLGRDGVRTWLLYEGARRRMVHRLGCPSHEEVSPEPEHEPVEWRSAPALHLSPMPVKVQQRWLAAAGELPARFVSVDPHDPVTEDSLGEWQTALARADAFFPGEDELRLEHAATDPRRVLPRLVSGRLRYVVYKRGVAGGILYDAREDRFVSWAARTSAVVDPTGSGDAFAAGFVSAHLEGLPVDVCLKRAVVTASFAIEDWGPAALLDARPAQADDRSRRWYGAEVQ
ncbi:MAG: carbohydrate kinase family protein [Acidobacteriota bacterium]